PPCPSEAEARAKRDEDIRKEIVALGKRYFLLSRHTSLLVLENDEMYARYGVNKGSGETWAAYRMPARIDVAKSVVTTPLLADVPDDAELVRAPAPTFYAGDYKWRALGPASVTDPFAMPQPLGGVDPWASRFGGLEGGGGGNGDPITLRVTTEPAEVTV